jgi:hypothetical protein
LQAEGIASRNNINIGHFGAFPNVTIAFHISLSLLALVASGECAFNVLKQVKNYYRSTVG